MQNQHLTSKDAIIGHINAWLKWSSNPQNNTKTSFVYNNKPNFNYGLIHTEFYSLVFDIKGHIWSNDYQTIFNTVNAYQNVKCEIGREKNNDVVYIILVKEDWYNDFIANHKRSSWNIDYESKILEHTNRPLKISYCTIL